MRAYVCMYEGCCNEIYKCHVSMETPVTCFMLCTTIYRVANVSRFCKRVFRQILFAQSSSLYSKTPCGKFGGRKT